MPPQPIVPSLFPWFLPWALGALFDFPRRPLPRGPVRSSSTSQSPICVGRYLDSAPGHDVLGRTADEHVVATPVDLPAPCPALRTRRQHVEHVRCHRLDLIT